MTLVTPLQRDLVVGDETKYGEVVREMRASGKWFLPTLGGEPFTHKPPLHFWLIDLLTFPLGVYSTWAFVIPSLMAFAFLLWIMWRMGGPVAAFVCGTSLMVWTSAQSARMDVAFTAFLALAIWRIHVILSREDGEGSQVTKFEILRRASPAQNDVVLAGIALGIATLIKGPMAPVIAIVYWLFRREKLRGNWWAGLAAMIVIPLLWFVPAMILGGNHYTQEVVMKQTVGRAIASWVHRAPPWYYLLHLPGIVLPWFFVFVVALRGANRSYLSWIAAVIVPYSLMSSKLDVYMMAMIPPMALLIADVVETQAARIANIAMLVILAIAGIAGPFIPIKGVDVDIRGVCIVLAVASIAGIIASLLRPPIVSTIALGLVPVVTIAYVAVAVMPQLNQELSTRRLIAALQRQNVAPETIALYASPYLWSRDFPRELERVRYVDPGNIGDAAVIVTARAHANEIAGTLRGYHRVDQVRMIGKWFDVYRK